MWICNHKNYRGKSDCQFIRIVKSYYASSTSSSGKRIKSKKEKTVYIPYYSRNRDKLIFHCVNVHGELKQLSYRRITSMKDYIPK